MTKELDKLVNSIQDELDKKSRQDFSEVALKLAHNKYKLSKLHGDNVITQDFVCSCGEKFKVYIIIQNDMIEDVSFEVEGCTDSKIIASQIAEIAYNSPITDALLITSHKVLNKLGKFPKGNEHCAKSATLTLHMAINKYLNPPDNDNPIKFK